MDKTTLSSEVQGRSRLASIRMIAESLREHFDIHDIESIKYVLQHSHFGDEIQRAFDTFGHLYDQGEIDYDEFQECFRLTERNPATPTTLVDKLALVAPADPPDLEIFRNPNLSMEAWLRIFAKTPSHLAKSQALLENPSIQLWQLESPDFGRRVLASFGGRAVLTGYMPVLRRLGLLGDAHIERSFDFTHLPSQLPFFAKSQATYGQWPPTPNRIDLFDSGLMRVEFRDKKVVNSYMTNTELYRDIRVEPSRTGGEFWPHTIQDIEDWVQNLEHYKQELYGH